MRSAHPAYRLYKTRLPTGLLMSLPILLVLAWYCWSAFAHVDRYARSTQDQAPWTIELLQIAVHDELVRDLRRILLDAPPTDSTIPTYSLSLTRQHLDALGEQLYSNAEREYVNGYVQKDGDIHEIRLRYRGSKPWHWIGAQKSMKLRLQRGDLMDGTRVFNLLNDPTPFGLEEQIILGLADEMGLLTPEYHPARVRLNNSDLGVFRYAAQPVEGLLRRGRRMPGQVFSGDSETVTDSGGVGDLFFSIDGWQQVAARGDTNAEEFAPLQRLLTSVASGSHAEFAKYASQHIDVERYAMFDALDVTFAGNEHDYFANHKFYYDPYRGRLEPIAWSFRGFQYEPEINLVDHPLLIRLKMTPAYLARRNRAVYSLLMQDASVPGIRARADRLFATMSADLRTDPYWDAYKLLPRVTRFHRFLVRPMSMSRWALAARAELFSYSRRVRFLLDQFERPNASASAWRVGTDLTRVDVVVDGHVSHLLRQVTVNADCGGPSIWRADSDRDGQAGPDDVVVAMGATGSDSPVDGYADLEPGVVLVPRPDARADRGLVKALPEARTYSYLVSTPCAATRVAMVLDNQVTGGSSRLLAAVVAGVPSAHRTLPKTDTVPTFAAGDRSAHLWDHAQTPAPVSVDLGPGIVHVKETRTFAAHQSVRIHPGTQLLMASGVSLFFHGSVHAVGSRQQPIVISADSDEAFGGIALQGPGTAGSKLMHVRIEGGSAPGGSQYPSMLSLYDTRDILLESVHISATTVAEDVLHATYVKNLRLHEVRIDGAPIDGVDLEFTDGQLRGLHVSDSGDDCLDLMGVDLRVTDSILERCHNNAISAGEESILTAHSLYIGDSDTGIMAKNHSVVRVTGSLIARTTTALRTKRRDVHYAGESLIGASNLHVTKCQRLLDEEPGSRIDTEQIQLSLPTRDALHHLGRNVLGLKDWDQFPTSFARSRKGDS